jgi:hypothetical protein
LYIFYLVIIHECAYYLCRIVVLGIDIYFFVVVVVIDYAKVSDVCSHNEGEKRARIDGTTNKVGKLAKMPHPPMPIHG